MGELKFPWIYEDLHSSDLAAFTWKEKKEKEREERKKKRRRKGKRRRGREEKKEGKNRGEGRGASRVLWPLRDAPLPSLFLLFVWPGPPLGPRPDEKKKKGGERGYARSSRPRAPGRLLGAVVHSQKIGRSAP